MSILFHLKTQPYYILESTPTSGSKAIKKKTSHESALDKDIQWLTDQNPPVFHVDLDDMDETIMELVQGRYHLSDPVIFPFPCFIVTANLSESDNPIDLNIIMVMQHDGGYIARHGFMINDSLFIFASQIVLMKSSVDLSNFAFKAMDYCTSSAFIKSDEYQYFALTCMNLLHITCTMTSLSKTIYEERDRDIPQKLLRKLSPLKQKEANELPRTINLTVGTTVANKPQGIAGAGSAKTAHDRRAHSRHYKNGKVIEVASSKIHGGSKQGATYNLSNHQQ